MNKILICIFIDRSPSSRLARDRDVHEKKMAKMEAEMKAVFQQKVAEKEVKLKQSEDEVMIVN